MKFRLLLYGGLCAALGLCAWLVLSHQRTRTLPPVAVQTAPAPVATPARTTPAAPSYAWHPLAETNTNAPDQEEMDQLVALIVNSAADYPARLNAAKQLPARLSAAALKQLYTFLQQSDPADAKQLNQVLKNEVMDYLCDLAPPPEGLLALLSQIYQDHGQDEVIRDYAVQHVVAFYQQAGGDAGMDTQEQKLELATARELLWSATTETDDSIGGTALLGLLHLSQQGWSGVDAQQLATTALKVAGDGGAGELARITALQVCGSLNTGDALAVVLGAVQSGGTLSIQISALGALGALGGKDQIPLLNSIIQNGNDRLVLPAQHALSQINLRLKQAAKNS